MAGLTAGHVPLASFDALLPLAKHIQAHHTRANSYLWRLDNAGYHHVVIIRGTPVPPYRQLAGILRDQIQSGELAPGQQLPSVLTLASEYGISVPTARKAIGLLKAEGLVIGVPGYGTFVAER